MIVSTVLADCDFAPEPASRTRPVRILHEIFYRHALSYIRFKIEILTCFIAGYLLNGTNESSVNNTYSQTANRPAGWHGHVSPKRELGISTLETRTPRSIG